MSRIDRSENRLAFREIFLVHTPPAGVASLRQAGRYMFTTVLESRLERGPEPPVSEQARALAEDLRYSARELAWLESASAGDGQRIFEWSDEETERHFESGIRDWSERQ